MKLARTVRLAAAGIVALGLCVAAQAQDRIVWSVGVAAAPGLTLNVGNVPQFVTAPPVYVTQAPVMMAPPVPVYRVVQPVPVAYPVYSSTVFMRPAPVIHSPMPRVAYLRHGYRHWHP